MDRTQAIKDYLGKNQEASFREFKSDMPKIKVTGQYFYSIRKNLRGGIGRKSRNPVYISFFTKDSKDLSPESKALLQEFILVLNERKKTRMEIVEYANPQKLEVREAQ